MTPEILFLERLQEELLVFKQVISMVPETGTFFTTREDFLALGATTRFVCLVGAIFLKKIQQSAIIKKRKIHVTTARSKKIVPRIRDFFLLSNRETFWTMDVSFKKEDFFIRVTFHLQERENTKNQIHPCLIGTIRSTFEKFVDASNSFLVSIEFDHISTQISNLIAHLPQGNRSSILPFILEKTTQFKPFHLNSFDFSLYVKEYLSHLPKELVIPP